MEEQRRASWRCSDTPDQTWRTSNQRPICNWPRSYLNPAKLACRNSRPDVVNNATKAPCPIAILSAMSDGAPEGSTTEISANTAAIANNVTANPRAFSRARQAPMNPTTSTLRYHRRSGCPESAVWTMVDHPKANPATRARPTPTLYDHAPILLATSANTIPVTKNRRYTRTKAP